MQIELSNDSGKSYKQITCSSEQDFTIVPPLKEVTLTYMGKLHVFKNNDSELIFDSDDTFEVGNEYDFKIPL